MPQCYIHTNWFESDHKKESASKAMSPSLRGGRGGGGVVCVCVCGGGGGGG